MTAQTYPSWARLTLQLERRYSIAEPECMKPKLNEMLNAEGGPTHDTSSYPPFHRSQMTGIAW